MAQELQRDPAFQQMQQVLQQSFASTMGANMTADPTAAPPADAPPADAHPFAMAGSAPGEGEVPAKAFEAMQQLYSNPQFLQMAEKIGQTMLEQNPVMRAMLDPGRREAMQERFDELKKDPDLAPVMEELESGDPQTMMKCPPLMDDAWEL